MTPERWRKVKDVFQAAMERPPAERASFLDHACEDDASLRREVESLLAADEPTGSLLAAPGAAGLISPRSGEAETPTTRRGRDVDRDNAFKVRLAEALVGRYEFVRELGRGGMATVYLARDVRHDRSVALKVLLPELAAALGTERFLSEIRVTANLQHPHLLPLFDSGEAGGELYYTMPYVAGESLRARLERERQLPVDEALRIAVAVAGALDYAHRHGVVHRDLKPENILVQDGQPVVADFGIALAVARAGGARVTQSGISLGTPHYMAPEQATADPHLDARADVYALGCVLYELLTGEPPYTGNSVQAVIAKILTDEPRPVRASRRAVPPHVEAAIAVALEKLPADRWPTARAFAEALEGRVVATPARHSGLLARPRAMSGLGHVSSHRFVVLAGCAITLFAISAAGVEAGRWWERRSAPPGTPVRFTLAPPGLDHVTLGRTITLAPDGRGITYIAPAGKGQVLYHRRLDQLQAKALAATDDAFDSFFVSPDGKWVAFHERSGSLKRVAIDGGSAVTIATSLSGPSGVVEPLGPGAWTPDNAIVLGSTTGLFRMPAAGGALESVTKLDTARGERAHVNPLVLPNGKSVAFTVLYRELRRPARIGVVALESKSRSTLDIPAGAPRGYLDGLLLVGRDDNTLAAVPFDVETNRVTGAPVTVLEEVLANPLMGMMAASVSANGSLAYVRGREVERLVVVDERGNTVGRAAEERRKIFSARFSPDGGRVVVEADAPGSRSAATDTIGIWIWDIASGAFSRVSSTGRALKPVWTPDGRRIVYEALTNGRHELWRVPADLSEPEERLYAVDSLDIGTPEVSPDGQFVLFMASGSGVGGLFDLWLLPLNDRSGGSARPLFRTPFMEAQSRISPNGRWLAYTSDESGKFEVYLRPFPGPGGRVQVSSDGGQSPVWWPDGRRLLYSHGDTNIAVTLTPSPASQTSSPTMSVSGRRPAFAGAALNGTSVQDIHPDGRRYVVILDAGEPPALVIVVNWLSELRARTGAARR